MRTAERTIIGIIVAGVLSTSLLLLFFIPPAKALPGFHSFIRGGSNPTPNKMSADEQPQGLNGMDLIIDGEQLNNMVTMSCAASRLAEDKAWLIELELLRCNRCSTFFT